MKIAITVILITLAATAGWYFGRNTQPGAIAGGERKVSFYQSPMHPWIKSEKPGNCTICGMRLTPVYEGEKGFDTDADIVTLSSNAINVLNVQTEIARRRPLQRSLMVAGRIESDETRFRVISAYVDGRIEKLFVNYTGAEVKPGEPLAEVYSPVLLTAEREYLTLLAQTNFATSPALQAQHERVVEGARHRLRRLGLTDEQINSMRPNSGTNFTTLVTAPIGGTVITRAAYEGQYVKEGDKLFEIADLSTMWFVFDVYEQDLPLIRAGEMVRVTSPALGSKSFDGPITFVDPNINLETRSARVRVELQNPLLGEEGRQRRELFNGLYAEGAIAIRTEPVLAVSKSAVLNPGDHPRVYVDQGGGAFEHRPVKTGRRGEEYIEIVEGLSEGARVVLSGNLLLDSQAQLNRSGTSAGPHEHHAAATESPRPLAPAEPVVQELSPEQIAAAKSLLDQFVFPINKHLAADNLEGYNEIVAHVDHLVPPFARAFGNDSPLREQIQKITSESEKLKPADDLATARLDYKNFSAATVDFYRAISAHTDFDAKMYKCPMFPKLGQNAFWLQPSPPLRNPFFGAEMLECGVEVK